MKKKKEEPTAPRDDSPPDEFCDWWYPKKEDPQSGASIGGHPDAARMWARKDPGHWTRRAYGITAATAWLVPRFRAQFNAWKAAGSPKREEEFISLALPLEEQSKCWTELSLVLKTGGKDVEEPF